MSKKKEVKCNCGPECDCGCKEGKECTCGCKEGKCTCGCNDDKCTCNDDKIKALEEALLRKEADLINYRKRKDEEVGRMLKYSKEDIAKDLLPIVDNFERAISLDDDNLDDELSKFLSGFKMIYCHMEDLLKKYYPTGYYKAKDSLKNVQRPSISTRHDVIYNNIFGNSNPNKSSSYPQYGKVKNFVYDINIQDVNPNINKINYPMYNATANNNYDSYPSPEEYKKMMEKVGQKNYAYAGGEFIEGVPFRGQRPVFIKNGIKNNLRPLNDIGINNNEIRYRNKKLDEYGMNTIGIKKPSTGYYKTEGNYNMNNININKEKVEENKYYLNKVPEAI